MWSVGALGGLLQDRAGVRWISMTQGDAKDLRNSPFVGIYATTAWIEKNPDLVRRLSAAYVDAIARLKTDTANASKLIKAKFFPDLDQAIWDDAFQQVVPAFFDDAKVSRADWEALLKLQKQYTGKDYARAAYDKVVLPQAQAK